MGGSSNWKKWLCGGAISGGEIWITSEQRHRWIRRKRSGALMRAITLGMHTKDGSVYYLSTCCGKSDGFKGLLERVVGSDIGEGHEGAWGQQLIGKVVSSLHPRTFFSSSSLLTLWWNEKCWVSMRYYVENHGIQTPVDLLDPPTTRTTSVICRLPGLVDKLTF
ncbi:uncharacterized protein DS421_10g307980 [Arachis hypogaea]|nr:uncharacterized protein DS421_10g307980 [Arachis hypogaea]